MTIPQFKPTITLTASNLTSSNAAAWVARVAACPIDTSLIELYSSPFFPLTVIGDTTASVATTSGVQATRTITLGMRQSGWLPTVGSNCTDLQNAFGGFMQASLTQCLCTPVAVTSVVIGFSVTPCT